MRIGGGTDLRISSLYRLKLGSYLRASRALEPFELRRARCLGPDLLELAMIYIEAAMDYC